MKFIKYENYFGKGAINLAHVVNLYMEQMYIDGNPLQNVYGVVAQLSFGLGEKIIYIGNPTVCQNYIDELVKEN